MMVAMARIGTHDRTANRSRCRPLFLVTAVLCAMLAFTTGGESDVAALPDTYEPMLVDDIESNIFGLSTFMMVATLDHVYFPVDFADGPLDPPEEIRRVNRRTLQVDVVVPPTAGLRQIQPWFVDDNTLYFSGDGRRRRRRTPRRSTSRPARWS